MADDVNTLRKIMFNISINKENYVKNKKQLEKYDRILRFTQVFRCFTVYLIFISPDESRGYIGFRSVAPPPPP